MAQNHPHKSPKSHRKIIFSGASIAGHEHNTSSVVVHDGKWYALNRISKPPNSQCKSQQMVLGLRESADQGRTWGAFRLVTSDESRYCALADGDLFFDQSSDRWLVLSQCLSLRSTWDMCLYSKNGRDPMLGDFVAADNNPIVRGGTLWSRICALLLSHCDSRIFDEGTPKILRKEDGYFFVTFHGYDGVRGYRGMAKSRDFANWVVSADDLPNGIGFSRRDCESLSQDCIGGGHASSLSEGEYHYLLIETPSGNLACKPGADWPISLYRSKKPNAKSGEFESFGENPLIRSNFRSPVGCELQYAHLFKDADEQIYLYVSYFSDKHNVEWFPAAVFRLEFGTSKARQIIINSETIATLNELSACMNNLTLTTP